MVSEQDRPHSGGPLLSYTRSMLDHANEWRMLGDYAIWSGSSPNNRPLRLHQLIGNRVLPVPISSARAILHPITRNSWFEVQGLFGFWMMADVDTVWLDAPGPGARYYSLYIGGAEGRPGEVAYGWVCPACGHLYGKRAVSTRETPFERLLDLAQEGVENFNAQAALRRCPECGHEHPPTYGFYADRDSEVSRTARAG